MSTDTWTKEEDPTRKWSAVAGCPLCKKTYFGERLGPCEAAVVAHANKEHRGWQQLFQMALRSSPTCIAAIHHGPGHQSTSTCELPNDKHEEHQYILGDRVLQWKGLDAFTDYFDENPR